jgi:hypothetical protein
MSAAATKKAAPPGWADQAPPRVHARSACHGRSCCIHNPSRHRLRFAPLFWRGWPYGMERVCEHGIGHPDPDDAAYRHAAGLYIDEAHTCDGCCRERRGPRHAK